MNSAVLDEPRWTILKNAYVDTRIVNSIAIYETRNVEFRLLNGIFILIHWMGR